MIDLTIALRPGYLPRHLLQSFPTACPMRVRRLARFHVFLNFCWREFCGLFTVMGMNLSVARHGDPRPWFALLLGVYVLCGLGFLGFGRTPWQAGLTVATAVAADFVLNRLLRQRGGFPWSGLITGLGLCLLLDFGSNVWLPILPPLLAIGSKHLFTVQGKHVYNPALFGLMAGMVLGGGLVSPAPAYQWNGTWAVGLFLVGLSLVLVMPKIGRGWLVGSFLVFYTIQTAFRAWVMRHHVPPEAIWLGTLSAPAFFLFTFYMLTDPATSPAKRGAQIGIAAAITVIDLGFHFRSSYYTLFYAAFTVQSARFAWALIKHRPLLARKALAGRAALAGSLVGVAWLVDQTPRGVTVSPGFVWVERETFPSRQGRVLDEIDPRLRHVGKWILSVGDAVAVGDINGNGLMDVFLTRPMKRSEDRCALYLNKGNLDLNGWPDMVQANGMVDDSMDRRFPKPRDYWYVNGQIARSNPEVHAYADRWGDMRGHSIWGWQANRVLLNRGGTFHEAAGITGLTRLGNTRGVALADFDNDGDADLILTRQFDSVLFYENRRSKPGSWVGFKVSGDGVTVNSDGVGTVLEVSRGAERWHATVLNVTGFSAQGDRRIVIGLDGDPAAVRLDVRWPDGSRDSRGTFESGQYHDIRKAPPVMPISSAAESGIR